MALNGFRQNGPIRITKQIRRLAATTLFSAGLMAAAGFLLLMPTSAKAVLVTIDEIIYQQDGSVNPTVLRGTADFSLLGNILTIVLTNTSTGATGGAAATNLLVGIGFNLPNGVTIANNGAINHVAITAGSSAFNFSAPISDSQWGAGNGALSAINNLTLLGDVNASASTLQAQVDFDLAGVLIPPPGPGANVDGPSFGMLTSNGGVTSTTCGGLACVQNSVTLTLSLGGTISSGLIAGIDAGHVVLSFGSPNPPTSVPEPGSLLLLGAALAGLGWMRRRKQS